MIRVKFFSQLVLKLVYSWQSKIFPESHNFQSQEVEDMVINDHHWCENMPMTASRTLTFGVGGARRKCPGDWHRGYTGLSDLS